MGFSLNDIFGSSGGYGWGKQQSQDLYGQYMGLGDQLYGNDAYRRNVSQFTGDMTNNYNNWMGARNQNLGGRGLRGSSSMGIPKFAGMLAQYQSGERARLGQGRLGFLQGAGGLLQLGAQLNYKQPKQGILSALSGAYAASQGMPSQGASPQMQGQSAGGYGGVYNGGYDPYTDLTNPYGYNSPYAYK